MAGRNGFAPARLNADRFDPVKGILEDEIGCLPGNGEDELVWKKWIRWRAANVEKKRGLVGHEAVNLSRPLLAPSDEIVTIQIVPVSAVINVEIVRWGGDDKVHAVGRKLLHTFQAVFLVEFVHTRVSLCRRGKESFASSKFDKFGSGLSLRI